MKTFLFILLLSFGLLQSNAQTNADSIIASCCDGGRCTGSAYCRVCKNCSRCAHCNSGGSCGVCSGRIQRSSYNSKSNGNNYSSSQNVRSSTLSSFNIGDVLVVSSETLNLREGPGIHYDIVGKLTKQSKLIFIEGLGMWLKVKVKETGAIGYVHSKYVKKYNE